MGEQSAFKKFGISFENILEYLKSGLKYARNQVLDKINIFQSIEHYKKKKNNSKPGSLDYPQPGIKLCFCRG